MSAARTTGPTWKSCTLLLKFLNKPESLIHHVQDRPGHDRRYSLDCTKMAGLGYHPERDRFEERLKETVEWYLANEAWWRAIKEKGHEYQQFMRQWYGRPPVEQPPFHACCISPAPKARAELRGIPWRSRTPCARRAFPSNSPVSPGQFFGNLVP